MANIYALAGLICLLSIALLVKTFILLTMDYKQWIVVLISFTFINNVVNIEYFLLIFEFSGLFGNKYTTLLLIFIQILK